MLHKTAILCSLLAVALASMATGPLQPKPEKFKHVEGCYVEELDAVIPLGESAASKTACLQYQCYETSLSYIGCGNAHAGPGVRLVEDKSKPYPDCCPRVEVDIAGTFARKH